MMNFKQKNAFTLVEFLVVVAAISIIMTLTFVVYGRIRRLGRDTVRVTHITQMQTALRAFYRDVGIYPTSLTTNSPLVNGNTTYMEQIPGYPQPVDGSCAGNSSYAYQQLSSGNSYQLVFCLGCDTADLKSGLNTASPSGITR